MIKRAWKMKPSTLVIAALASLSACSRTARSDDMPDLPTESAQVPKNAIDPKVPLITDDSETTHSAAVPTAAPTETVTRQKPDVATTPYQSQGFWMNAYYFVRDSHESWDSVSHKLYGRADRQSLLRQWNNGAHLRVGQVVYYNSPTRPDDSQNLKVFTEDFGFTLDKVTLQKGDSLSLLGKRLYGHYSAWREIAALNPSITNPDRVAAGQVLVVQPVTVDTGAVLDHLLRESGQVPQTAPVISQTDTRTTPDSELPPPSAIEAPKAVATVTAPSKTTVPTVIVTTPTPQHFIVDAPIVKVTQPRSAPTTGLQPMSFKSSSLLGLFGTLLLIVAAGMLSFRKLSKLRISKGNKDQSN